MRWGRERRKEAGKPREKWEEDLDLRETFGARKTAPVCTGFPTNQQAPHLAVDLGDKPQFWRQLHGWMDGWRRGHEEGVSTLWSGCPTLLQAFNRQAQDPCLRPGPRRGMQTSF